MYRRFASVPLSRTLFEAKVTGVMPVPQLRGLLIDLSGTLHVGDKATPGASEAVEKLRQAGVALRWLSNTSKESRKSLLRRLHAMNLDVREEELFTSLTAVRNLVDQDKLNPLFILSPSAMDDFVPKEGPYDSVVTGLAPSKLDYKSLNDAFRLLSGEVTDITQSARLIATHKAMYYRADDGKLSLGPGPFISALEEASGVKAEIVGKPSKSFFKQAMHSFEEDGICDPKQIGIIGDDSKQDVGQEAEDLGLYRMLVQTGKYRYGDESLNLGHAPDWVGVNFAKAAQEIIENQKFAKKS